MASQASLSPYSGTSHLFDPPPSSKTVAPSSWTRSLTKIGAVAMCILITLSGAQGNTSLLQECTSADCQNTTSSKLLFDLQSACPNHTWTGIPFNAEFPRGDECLTSLDEAYAVAVEDAKVAEEGEDYPLKPIPDGTVTVVSWIARNSSITHQIERQYPDFRQSLGVRPSRAFTSPISITIDRPTWVVLESEVKNLCRNWNLTGPSLNLRIVQLLGLPDETNSDYKKLAVAIMQISSNSLRRPCFDVVQDANGTIRCTGPLSRIPHKEAWDRHALCGHLHNSYNPLKNRLYPVTAMGYAFDWHCGNPTDYGTTELVILPNITIQVDSVLSTDAFCLQSGPKNISLEVV